MNSEDTFTLGLTKDEIVSIISALRATPEWTVHTRIPIISKLERRLRQIDTDIAERAKYDGPDYLVGI